MISILPARADDPASVVLVQESNGFPGGEEAIRLSRQQVAFRGGRLRVFDPSHLWALYVSLDQQQVQEASIGSQEYVLRDFAHYQKYRDDRARSLESQRNEYTRLKSRIDDADELDQLRRDYLSIGGDPEQPGRIVARLQPYPNDTKTVTILVDRQPRDVTVEHFVIRENQKDVAAFDLWLTKDIEIPVDLLDFYRQLVPFGPEVTEELAKVEGTLIECTAAVDTGTFHRTFRSKVLEIRLEEQLSEADVTLPQGWQQVTAQERKGPDRGNVICVVTGQEVPREDALSYRDPRNGKRYWVADSEARKALIKMLSRGEQPPHAGEGGS